jgi:enoyl-CoA hydratase/carnithine racemase
VNYEKYQALEVERDGDILTITLNRPDKKNSVDARMHDELSTVFHEVRADDAKVVVVTGAGDTFCMRVVPTPTEASEASTEPTWRGAASDFDYYVDIDEEAWLRTVRQGKWIVQDMLAVPQPIIVGMNGHAMGLGSSLVCMGDFIIAAEGAYLADHHAPLGLVASDGGAMVLPLTLGLMRAKEYFMLGKEFPAEELRDLGLVHKVVPRDQLDSQLRQLAQQLAAMPTEALQWTKSTLNRMAQFSALLSLDGAMGHEGWSWHLTPAQEMLRTSRRLRDETARG